MTTNKQTIIVTNGKYKDRIFNAVIGNGGAFVEIGTDTITEIPEGSFELFRHIPEAFDSADQIHLPKIEIETASFDDDESKPIHKRTGQVWNIPWEQDPRTLALSKDNDEVRAKNKALKARSAKKAESNDRLTKENDRLKSQIQALTVELEEVHSLNNHHRNEVENGNERREKIKQTVEALHKQIGDQSIKLNTEIIRANKAEEQLERANRVIDKLTKW